MSEDLYNIVFNGELVRSCDLATAKLNLGQLFKMDAGKVEALFSGKSVTLKRNLNFETANKYRVAIKKAGARVDLMPVEEKKPVAPPSQGKAVFGERVSEQPPSAPADTRPVSPSQPSPPLSAPSPSPLASATNEDGMFSLAPAGSDVLSPSERKEVPEAHIDTSQLSVKENVGDLLEESEKRHIEELDIDLSGVDLAPPGGDLLKENEKKKVEPAAVDTSALSVAEPGARMSKPAPAPPPPPDVSGITLE